MPTSDFDSRLTTMPVTPYLNRLTIIGLFCLSLILFTWGLRSEEIISFDSRFYLFALEMWQTGPSWFPTTYHEPYPDYLATSTLLIYFVAMLLGSMNKLAAVLPSAIAASLTVVLTYMIGALNNKRLGLYAAFFLLLTVAFLKNARGIALDMYPTMITALCFYLVYSAQIKSKPCRAGWIYPLLVLGFAFRGPIGLVIPTGVICTYYLLDLNIRKFFITGFIALILLIVCAITLLGLAYHVGGSVFLHDVLRMQVVGRIDNSYLPAYFYFVDGMRNYAPSFPMACLTVIGVVIYFKEIPHAKFLLKLIGWVVIILLGMSIPGDKKTRYILPMVPAIALLAAYPFAITIGKKYFVLLRSIFLRIFLYFPAIFLLVTEAIFFYAKNRELDFGIHYLSIVITLIVMQLIALSIVFRYLTDAVKREVPIVFIATLSFVMTYIAVIEPIELSINRARDFVTTIEAERLQQHAHLVFFKERPDSLPIKYLVNMSHDLPNAEQPIFIGDTQSLLGFTQPAFFITSASYFESLSKEVMAKFEIIASDKIGRVRVIVFKRKSS